MVNIDQLIEEESNKYVSSTALIELGRFCYEGTVTEREAEDMIETASQESFQTGARFVLSKWQEANRWRKVSEELPEVRDESYQILIRIPNIKSSATVWNIRNQSDCDIIAKMGNSEWKPIS